MSSGINNWPLICLLRHADCKARPVSPMEKTADVVIIGGGVIVGLSIAYHLALKKAGKIVLFEKGQLGEGSTSRCVGGIRTQFSTEINIRLLTRIH